jgi:hypothetical protein
MPAAFAAAVAKMNVGCTIWAMMAAAKGVPTW